LASRAFQTTTPRTHALITSAKRITIAVGAICRLNDALVEELGFGINGAKSEKDETEGRRVMLYGTIRSHGAAAPIGGDLVNEW
jgi:hypothetical protein